MAQKEKITHDLAILKKATNGTTIKISEESRKENMLVIGLEEQCGVASRILLPIIISDLKKKKEGSACGMTVITRTESLAKETVKTALEYGMKVNLIDPEHKVIAEKAINKSINPFHIPKRITKKEERELYIRHNALSATEMLLKAQEIMGEKEQYFSDVNTTVMRTVLILCMLSAALKGQQATLIDAQKYINDIEKMENLLKEVCDALMVKAEKNDEGHYELKPLQNDKISTETAAELHEEAAAYENEITSAYAWIGDSAEMISAHTRGLRNAINRLLLPQDIKNLLADTGNAIDEETEIGDGTVTVMYMAPDMDRYTAICLEYAFLSALDQALTWLPKDTIKKHFIVIEGELKTEHLIYEKMCSVFKEKNVFTTLRIPMLTPTESKYITDTIMRLGIQLMTGYVTESEIKEYEQLAGKPTNNSVMDQNYKVKRNKGILAKLFSQESNQPDANLFIVQEGMITAGHPVTLKTPMPGQVKEKKNEQE